MNKRTNHKNNPKNKANSPKRKVDEYFESLNATFTNQNNLIPYFILVYLLFFGVLGMIWMIPFPQLGFLVRWEMHTFLNWASIYIAIIIYTYLKLAPTLSYGVLLSIGVMSFFIVQLEYIERDGGPAVWLVCLLITLLSLIGLKIISAKEKNKVQSTELIRLITIGPIWMWCKVFDRFKWKY